MSKTALKKELSSLTHEQIIQIIADAYDSSPEFKEYFEFFLNPDIKKLMEKSDKAIMKELGRVKWGYSKFRITVIKKIIKKFIGFNPGPEAVLDMLFMTLNRLALTERYTNFMDSQLKYVEALTRQIVHYAEEHELISDTMVRLNDEINCTQYTIYFRRFIAKGIAQQ